MLTRVLPILPIKEQQPRFLDTRWEAANSLHSALLEPCDGTLWRHPCSFHPPLQTALAPIGGSDQIYIHLELPTVQMDLRTYISPPVQTSKYWAGFLLRISTGSGPWWPTKILNFNSDFVLRWRRHWALKRRDDYKMRAGCRGSPRRTFL